MKRFLLIPLLVLMCSCDKHDMSELFSVFDDVNQRVDVWLDWFEDNPIEITSSTSDYRFYVCSDLHVNGDAHALGRVLDSCDSDSRALFSVINGDLITIPDEPSFACIYDTVSRHGKPCFATIGNHDVARDGVGYYKKYFNSSTYYVVVRLPGGESDVIIFLDSASGTLGNHQSGWLLYVLTQWQLLKCRNCIVVTHTYLYRTSHIDADNFSIDETCELMNLFTEHNVNLVLMGHFHRFESLFFGGVQYVMSNNLNDDEAPSYLTIDCGDGTKCTEVMLH